MEYATGSAGGSHGRAPRLIGRRGFLGAMATAAAGMTLDPERLLWVPGAKTFFLPPEKPTHPLLEQWKALDRMFDEQSGLSMKLAGWDPAMDRDLTAVGYGVLQKGDVITIRDACYFVNEPGGPFVITDVHDGHTFDIKPLQIHPPMTTPAKRKRQPWLPPVTRPRHDRRG